MKAISLVILLMTFGVIAGGTMLESSALVKHFDTSRRDFREREETRDILDAIVGRFAYLAALDADDEGEPVLEAIRRDYTAYNLMIEDISSGCNLNFLPDADLADTAMASFLFAGESADAFLSFRRRNGFVTGKAEWKPFLKDEAWEAVVCKGWFSVLHGDSETGRMLAASYGRSGEALYPLMNMLPLINVNTADPAIFAPLLSRRSWRISGAAAKAAALKERVTEGAIDSGDLRSILSLPESHDLYRYLGVRTAFWGLSFRNGPYRLDAVIAAIPERESDLIERYTIIEGRLHREP